MGRVVTLLEALAWQHDEPPDQIQERAKQGLGVNDRVGLPVLVRELFGEEYLPTPLSRDLKAALPAVSSRWALPGFSRLAEEDLPAAGIDVEEAIAWRALGLSRPHQMVEAHPYGFHAIRNWVEVGFEPMQAVRYLRTGRTLDQLVPYVAAGCRAPAKLSFTSKPTLGPEVVTEFQTAGNECGPSTCPSSTTGPTVPRGTSLCR